MEHQEPEVELRRRLDEERQRALLRVEERLELPMIILGFLWLVLLVTELIYGASPLFQTAGTAIWIIFLLDFAVEFLLAPAKTPYLRRNWLTLLALVIPALRIFRAARALGGLRAARAARGLRLLRLVTSLNRGMGVLGKTLGRRGFGYVAALTLLVVFLGAAGIYTFENNPGGRGLNSYGTALWWTAMIMTTMGSEYWPQTPEGRALCLFLALYAFTMFGYITATLASFFVVLDAGSDETELADSRSIEELRRELRALRSDLQSFGGGRNWDGP